MEIYASACFPLPGVLTSRPLFAQEFYTVVGVRYGVRRVFEWHIDVEDGAQWRQLASAPCNEEGCEEEETKEEGRNARLSGESRFPVVTMLASFPR